MKHLMIRADDLGYSEGINYGIEKSVKKGVINNVGMMANMDSCLHGYDLIKNVDLCLGMHANISAGRPVLPPSGIPSLIGQNGYFKQSKEYRSSEQDFVVLEEAAEEIEAQYKRFVKITGKTPDYIDVHGVKSRTFFSAAKQVADTHGVPFSGLTFDKTPVDICGEKLYIWQESMDPNYDPVKVFVKMNENYHENAYDILVYHPGYLDWKILQTSSLTIPRAREVEAACGEDLKHYINEQEIHLYTYREII